MIHGCPDCAPSSPCRRHYEEDRATEQRAQIRLAQEISDEYRAGLIPFDSQWVRVLTPESK